MRPLTILSILLMLSFSPFVKAQIDSDCNQPESIVIGVNPWISSQFAQLWSEKIAKHFAEHCINAQFKGSHSLVQFLQSAQANEFDLIDVPPHFASYLMQDAGYTLIGIENYNARPIFFRHIDAPIKNMTDWQGQRFDVPDELSMINMIARHEFSTINIQPNFSIQRSHDYVLMNVLGKSSFGGAVLSPIIESLSTALRQKLIVFMDIDIPLNGAIIASPKHSPDFDKKIKTILALFNVENDQGRFWQNWQTENLDEEKIISFHHVYTPYVERIREILLQEDLTSQLK